MTAKHLRNEQQKVRFDAKRILVQRVNKTPDLSWVISVPFLSILDNS